METLRVETLLIETLYVVKFKGVDFGVCMCSQGSDAIQMATEWFSNIDVVV